MQTPGSPTIDGLDVEVGSALATALRDAIATEAERCGLGTLSARATAVPAGLWPPPTLLEELINGGGDGAALMDDWEARCDAWHNRRIRRGPVGPNARRWWNAFFSGVGSVRELFPSVDR